MGDIFDDGVPIKVVQIDALVVMKIIKHCTESYPEYVTGQLLGLDVGTTLEVTNCFSFPQDKDDDEKAGARYQLQMMKNLREINVDNNAVGWYQPTYFGSFLTETMIESQFSYQTNLPKSVVLVYDPLKAKQGLLSFKAYRLNKNFMELMREKKFTAQSLQKLGTSEVFEEIPVVVRNSLLASALLQEVETKTEGYEQLELTNDPYLEKSMEYLIDYVDQMTSDQVKLQQHYRQVSRTQYQQQQYIQKRKLEDAQRAANGEPPLPEEDLSDNPLFKPIPEPSRLEGLLISNQIESYCKQINQFASQSFSKLFLTEGLFSRS